MSESFKTRAGQRTDDGSPYDDEPADELPCRFIDDYELVCEIARGGMGIVYKARDTRLKCDVALKMIRSGEFAGREQVERFYGEAEAAAQLQHPGIVRIHRVGRVAGLHYFTMDLIDGSSLTELADDLVESDVLRYGIEVCEAVEYAHQRGIVHRDIKPSNVLVDQSGRALVTDFGLAKQIEQQSGLSEDGQALGTPGYMPPEQAEGRRDGIGFHSDIYSIGALLYHLLTGRPPFDGTSQGEVLHKVINTDPVAPGRSTRRSRTI